MPSVRETICCDSGLQEAFQSSLRLLEELVEFSAAQLWEVRELTGRPLLRAEAGRQELVEAGPVKDEATARELYGRLARGPCHEPLVAYAKELSSGKALSRLGISSLAALPIGDPGSPWALLILYTESPLESLRRREGFMKAVAAQTSLALENVGCTLPTGPQCRKKKNAKRWKILKRHVRRVSPKDGLEQVASVLAGAAEDLWGTSILLVWMLDETTGALHLAGTFGSASKDAAVLVNPKEPLAEMLLHSDWPIVVKNLESDSLWRNQVLAEVLGLKTLLGVPLILEGRALGALMLLSPSPEKLMPGDEPLLEVFAMQMLAALELCRVLEGLKESRERYLQAEGFETLAELAMGETHDFNNALGLILGNAHMLRSKLASTEEALRALDVIEHAVNDAAERVKRLQGLKSKIAYGPRVEQVNLNNLAEELLQVMRNKFKGVLVDGGTIEVQKDLRCTFPVLANQALLKEALLKVVSNSVRSMPKGGKITLKTWEDLEKVHLSVSDTRQDLSSVGKKVVAGRPLSAKFSGGPGMSKGIATACSLIESLDGEIVIHKEKGMGTTVTITFPKAERQFQASL